MTDALRARVILRPAQQHPMRRNLLMIVVHLVWGSVNALSTRELLQARSTILGPGPLRDAHEDAAALLAESVTINRPARELYDFWRDLAMRWTLPRWVRPRASLRAAGQ